MGLADQRGTYAGELADQLHIYALTIKKDLDDLEHHRRVVIDHLAGNVTQTIKLLARLQRRTSLPEGLDDWSKRTFLNLTHPKLPTTPGELAGRVATVVDQICSDSAEVRTSGMDLLYAGCFSQRRWSLQCSHPKTAQATHQSTRRHLGDGFVLRWAKVDGGPSDIRCPHPDADRGALI